MIIIGGYLYLLLILAILPAVLLLFLVYKNDKNGKEPRSLLIRLLVLGAVTTMAALIVESIGSFFFDLFYDLEGGIKYIINGDYSTNVGFFGNMFDYFVIVALTEEGFKFLALYQCTWNHKAFDYKYDGIVYAVFVSLGFALIENIEYVFIYGGFSTAVIRALTAIPGHCSFAIIMGTFYGSAKYFESIGDMRMKNKCLRFSLFLPVIVHGFYDFCVTISTKDGEGIILGILIVGILYLIALFALCLTLLLYQSKHDEAILQGRDRITAINIPENSPAVNGYINQNQYSQYINPSKNITNMYNPNDYR